VRPASAGTVRIPAEAPIAARIIASVLLTSIAGSIPIPARSSRDPAISIESGPIQADASSRSASSCRSRTATWVSASAPIGAVGREVALAPLLAEPIEQRAGVCFDDSIDHDLRLVGDHDALASVARTSVAQAIVRSFAVDHLDRHVELTRPRALDQADHTHVAGEQDEPRLDPGSHASDRLRHVLRVVFPCVLGARLVPVLRPAAGLHLADREVLALDFALEVRVGLGPVAEAEEIRPRPIGQGQDERDRRLPPQEGLREARQRLPPRLVARAGGRSVLDVAHAGRVGHDEQPVAGQMRVGDQGVDGRQEALGNLLDLGEVRADRSPPLVASLRGVLDLRLGVHHDREERACGRRQLGQVRCDDGAGGEYFGGLHGRTR
jgi:hypothetical protein